MQKLWPLSHPPKFIHFVHIKTKFKNHKKLKSAFSMKFSLLEIFYSSVQYCLDINQDKYYSSQGGYEGRVGVLICQILLFVPGLIPFFVFFTFFPCCLIGGDSDRLSNIPFLWSKNKINHGN